MSIERMHDTTGLISPPPEETLQISRTSVSKRKRTTPQPQQTTPNPKPRKQTRRPSPVESPTRPALPVRTRRTTPIPAYEPPTDVFTPPRVVIKTPTISKSSKRKSTNRKRASTAELFVKIEPPQIDLSAPHSPGSPTDDPILLSVASSSPIRPRRQDAAVGTDPLFDVTDPSVCVWSDDDDDNLVEGEYTGCFRTFNIRTKLDPPSSATRERQEEWGRPITPFPYRKIERLDLLKEEDEQEEARELSLETLGQKSIEPESTYRGPFDFDVSFEEVDSNMEQDNPIDPAIEHVEDEEEETRASAGDMQQDAEQVDTSIEEVPAIVHGVEHEETEAETYDMEQDTDEADTSIEEVPALVYHVDQDDNEADTSIEEVPALVYDVEHEEVDTSIEENPAAAHCMERDDDETDISIEEAPEVVHAVEQDDNEADTSTKEPQVMQDVEVDVDNADTSIEEASAPSHYMEQDTDTDEEADTSVEEHPATIRDVEQDADEADEREVREMSLSLDDDEEPIAIATPALHDEDSSSDEEELEYGLVKISSADPHAAARAAAILKQHDYDCFTRLALRTQKGRHSLSASGINKKRSPRDRMRRRTLGASVIGDKVWIPGSPATTLPELLKEAEAAIVGTPTKLGTSPHLFTPVARPSVTRGLARSLFENTAKERAWTKEEWKLLDACFTDERIALGPGDGQLASVDRVNPENVVRRFEDQLGGRDVIVKWGEDWTMENLVKRVKALQNKQRKGIVAPPTTPNTPRTSLTNPSASLFTNCLSSMEVPDFTPLGRRAAPPGRRPALPTPVAAGAPFNDLQDTQEHEQERPKKKLPLSLLAPRYSHLLDEAVAVSQLPDPSSTKLGPGSSCASSNDGDSEEAEIEAAAETEAGSGTASPPSPVPAETTTVNPAPPSTLKTRVKGFLFSYLPTLSKKPVTNPKPLSSRPGLPLPPPSVLEKCRGPVTTPARAPVPRPTHPKELVHLNPAPVPPKPSLIPRPQKPQRLVELHRVSPPPLEKDTAVIRPRRSSASSVKDLVRSFEEMEKNAVASRAEEQKRGELKRVKSVGEWRRTAGLANAGGNGSKPSWRP